jgi:hypothetical protein
MIVIQVTGGNCFDLAAKYLGDATQFIRIMQANNFKDPQLQGLTTVVIPDLDPSQTGGEPTQ